MKQIEQKKSAIDLTELAIGILMLGIVVGVGAYLLGTFRDSRVESLPTYLVRNETIQANSSVAKTLSVGWVKSVDLVINKTVGNVITAANYSTSTAALTGSANGITTITPAAQTDSNNTQWDVSYTVYNVSDPQWKVPDKATLGLQEYGNWYTILVVVGIAALILGLIFLVLGNRNSASDSGGVNF